MSDHILDEGVWLEDKETDPQPMTFRDAIKAYGALPPERRDRTSIIFDSPKLKGAISRKLIRDLGPMVQATS